MTSEEGDSPARVVLSQATFRSANQGIAEKARELDVRQAPLPFVCECEDRACREVVRVTLVEYEEVRTEPKQFLLTPGHERADERVVKVTDRYVVAVKEGEAGRMAAELDF